MATKTVHMAVYDTFSDWEVGYATAHVNNGFWQREPGSAGVITVAETEAPVRSAGGMLVTPETTLAELSPAESAMLILPGADTWMTGGNAAFATKAREFLDAGVPVAAICGATFGLAREGLLDDRPHTSNDPALLELSGYQGAQHYRDVPVVADGELITAGADRPVEFAREVLEALDLYAPGVVDSWYKLYGEHDPAGYYELEAAGR
jgi:putative intracellular protease/amidase